MAKSKHRKPARRKKIVIAILAFIALIIGVALGGFLLPGKTTVSKNILVNAPAGHVFEELEDLERWPAWSYWPTTDPTMEITYGKIKKGLRANYTWTGKRANGFLVIYGHIPNESLMIEVEFSESAKAAWKCTLEPDGNVTKLTMDFEFDNGKNHFNRWIGFLMIKPEVKKAFDYELRKLKEIAEDKPTFSITITEESLAPTYYAGINHTLTTHTPDAAQLATVFRDLTAVLNRSNVSPTGPPFCVFAAGGEKSSHQTCGLTIPPDAKLPAQYPILQHYSGAAARGIHTGGYASLAHTHDELEKYIAYKHFKLNGAAWEVYVTGPLSEPDSAKWVTEVFYPVTQ